MVGARRRLQTAGRRTLRFLLSIVVGLALAAAAGMLIPRPFWPAPAGDENAGERRHILVLSNPIHTDIAIPLDAETRERFAFLADNGMPLGNPNARWLVFGWGGRAFYLQTPTWAQLKMVPLVKGLTLDRSVIHADVAGDIREPSDFVTGFTIGPAGYQRLLTFIEGSIEKADGPITAIPGVGYGANDQFFEANGWFSALLGCNTWTAAALRAAGIRTGWWNPLPVSLRTSLRLFN